MYLKQAVIENSGPLRRIDLDLLFSSEGAPMPLVLVGTNGGGKTNILSLITDALFEAAAAHYENVLPAIGAGRAWFRLVGGRTTTVGTLGGFTLFRFEHAGETLIYKEKAGTVDPNEAKQRVPADFTDWVQWPVEGSVKEFPVTDDTSRRIFEEGVYAYFPSSRSEIPYWLNRESLPKTEFDVFTAFTKRMRTPIFVERSLDQLKQWLISVILESRAHIGYAVGQDQSIELHVLSDVNATIISERVLTQCNVILRRVLDDEQVRFVWLGRKSPDKIAVARQHDIMLPNLDALSGGQSILLGLFGTLLRYGDQSNSGQALELEKIEGICVVDEIDAHIHVDLQHRILPSLIKLFPRVQFIISSHSPLFVIGMEKEFGTDGFQLVEMPGGHTVTAESYSEFGKAMQALTATEAFNQRLLLEAAQPGLPIVFVEGETDTPYIRRAAQLLNRAELLERCDIQWIGAKDDGGQGFHTGKAALDHTLAVLRANPKLSNRPVLLLYDSDAMKGDADYASVSVRSMPTNSANAKVRAGIENLLAGESISDPDYEVVETPKPNGDVITRKTLRKAELCQRMCEQGSSKDFSAFSAALDKIEAYLNTAVGGDAGTQST
ncbi:MAG: AAA family ATPase [Sphingomonas sp.]|uniref:AAA family ATPase n=1 Tax=Sphingomonas sp. TaxID=28214 RepID=UPI0025CBD58C|nr:AAA family ATPase [Sphingomonas sp.]MBY0282430.1 AAA family ATPase [Sphingomonas sp.]